MVGITRLDIDDVPVAAMQSLGEVYHSEVVALVQDNKLLRHGSAGRCVQTPDVDGGWWLVVLLHDVGGSAGSNVVEARVVGRVSHVVPSLVPAVVLRPAVAVRVPLSWRRAHHETAWIPPPHIS